MASGYSLRHGASLPSALVGQAVDHGMDILALTDRDGLYGAVRFATACQGAGVRPVLGVDLAVAATTATTATTVPNRPSRRTSRVAPRAPARGGTEVDPRHPRVTVLAQGRAGWAALCRLVSATHLGGERGVAVSTRELIAEHAGAAATAPGGAGGLVVLLGPDSEVGRVLTRGRPDLARSLLAGWRAALLPGDLVLEVVSHRAGGGALAPYSTAAAAGMLDLARDCGLPAVLTNVVRYAERRDAPVVDVLDATRRLVALDSRHVDRANAEGYLKSGK